MHWRCRFPTHLLSQLDSHTLPQAHWGAFLGADDLHSGPTPEGVSSAMQVSSLRDLSALAQLHWQTLASTKHQDCTNLLLLGTDAFPGQLAL